MAPWGSVIKNGLVFALLSAGALYLGAVLLVYGLSDVLVGDGIGTTDGNRGQTNPSWFTQGIREVWIGLVISITLVGIIFMKALSDTVEDGMVEF